MGIWTRYWFSLTKPDLFVFIFFFILGALIGSDESSSFFFILKSALTIGFLFLALFKIFKHMFIYRP